MPFLLTHSCIATKKAEHCSRFHVEGNGRHRSYRQARTALAVSELASGPSTRHLITRNPRLFVSFVKNSRADDQQQYSAEQSRRRGYHQRAVNQVIEGEIGAIRQLARGPTQHSDGKAQREDQHQAPEQAHFVHLTYSPRPDCLVRFRRRGTSAMILKRSTGICTAYSALSPR